MKKSWAAAKLAAGVKKGDADALAEWAYCSVQVCNAVPYSTGLIYERAKKAAELGSPLGANVLANCHIYGTGTPKNPSLEIKWMKKCKKMGHPLGEWQMAVFQRVGVFGLEKDTSRAEEKMLACVKKGVWQAKWSLATIYESGQLGVIDLKKSTAYNIELL